ncbi:MAG: BMP family ABC transporter substrate-binding protein [Firmicutes bacterium]|nr:BMP family ABC transporter substrate-binding protein [Bacillota bacterium]
MTKRKMLVCILILVFSLSGLSTAVASGEELRVILVTDIGGLGDKGFNDGGWLGVQMAEKKLGVKGNVIQSFQQTDFIPNLTTAARQADVVVALGFLMVDAISEVAARFPDVNFVLVDSVAEDLPNLASYEIRAGQGSYLAGIVAAATTKTGRVGMVEPMSIPPVIAFTAGLGTGIKTWNELTGSQVELVVKDAGAFNDPARGKALALSMIGQNVDIMMSGANTGLGVFQAVKEKNEEAGIAIEAIADGTPPQFLGIGLDLDQDDIYPGMMLTSALKNVPEVIFGAIKDVQDGTFKGGSHAVGIQENATGITDMRYTKNFVPDKALAIVDKAIELMRAGNKELEIPLAVDNAQEFIESFTVPQELYSVVN